VNRLIVLIALMVTSAGATDLVVQLTKEEAVQFPSVQPYDAYIPNEPVTRKLLLNAAGVKDPGPGQIRIPVTVDGAAYEVIVVKPGEPKLVPVVKRDAD